MGWVLYDFGGWMIATMAVESIETFGQIRFCQINWMMHLIMMDRSPMPDLPSLSSARLKTCSRLRARKSPPGDWEHCDWSRWMCIALPLQCHWTSLKAFDSISINSVQGWYYIIYVMLYWFDILIQTSWSKKMTTPIDWYIDVHALWDYHRRCMELTQASILTILATARLQKKPWTSTTWTPRWRQPYLQSARCKAWWARVFHPLRWIIKRM